jgi:hypothetical protein
VQVPALPATLQASQDLSQAVLQQTPSAAQKPLAHSFVLVHVAPFAFLATQPPPLQ